MAKLRQPPVFVFGLALLAMLGAGPLVTAQEFLRLSRNIPGEAAPITLNADEIVTWTEGGQRVVLLKGKVLVEHSLVNLRTKQAVIWVDEARYRQTRILHVQVYGDGEVKLESGAEGKAGAKALLDLNTRGELRIRSHGAKVLQEARPADPFYQQALRERTPGAPPARAPDPPAAPVKPPVPPKPSAGVRQTSNKEMATGPSGPVVVPAQAIAPAEGAAAPVLIPAVVVPPAPVPARDAGGNPIAPVPSSPSLQPPAPGGPSPPPLVPKPPAGPPPAAGPPRIVQVRPRTSAPFQTQSFPQPNGEQAIVVSGGISLLVRNLQNVGMIDIDADRLVFWTKGNNQGLFGKIADPKGKGEESKELEFYLAGNVEIRQTSPQNTTRTLRADEVYYDVGRNVAVAVSGDLEFRRPNIPDPIHFRADELVQLGPNDFQGKNTEMWASRLPSDPGIKIYVKDADLHTERRTRRSIFGRAFVNRDTQQEETEEELYFKGQNVFFEVADVPVFYLPYLAGNARNPLGPLKSVGTGYSQVFGYQAWATFDIYELLGMDPLKGTNWRFDVDYLSERGPALGTNFDFGGREEFFTGTKTEYAGLVKAWGIRDTGVDQLGGGRGQFDNHPIYRGRFTARENVWELPYGFTVQGQTSVLSDKNFLEQYYKAEFDNERNQDTFLYVKQQQDVWAWTVLAEPNIRRWVTETEWLPRADGHLIGLSFFDRLTYNANANVAYAHLHPTQQPPPPLTSTDTSITLGRFDLRQELSAPLQAGPFKVVPYGIVELTEYTNYLNSSLTYPASDTDNSRGRFYGAVGVRGSIPFTRLYPEIESELFNVNGVNHKITLASNFFVAHSDTPFYRLPQLDRINDDATDQALRDITPLQPIINPAHGFALQNSTLYNPQFYAIRRLVDNRVDTLDSIEELEMSVNQRWQTKRGYPGLQHITDWMSLDLSATYFPHPTQDNFGSTFAFLQYAYTWNIGDRTTFESTGWYDPIQDGTRLTTVGLYFNRPDRTNFYVGYRQIDPLQSKAVTGAVSYVFSPKYAISAASVYDFGTSQSLSNYLSLTRMGTDVQVTVGVTYNAVTNDFGAIFQIIPNLVPQAGRLPGVPVLGPSPFAAR